MFAHFGGHTRAAVADLDDGVLGLLPGSERERAALGHGIDGVKDEVGQHLPQRGFIAGGRMRGPQVRANFDVGAVGLCLVLPFRLRKRHDLLDQGIDVDRGEDVVLLVRTIEFPQPPDDARRVSRAGMNHPEVVDGPLVIVKNLGTRYK